MSGMGGLPLVAALLVDLIRQSVFTAPQGDLVAATGQLNRQGCAPGTSTEDRCCAHLFMRLRDT